MFYDFCIRPISPACLLLRGDCRICIYTRMYDKLMKILNVLVNYEVEGKVYIDTILCQKKFSMNRIIVSQLRRRIQNRVFLKDDKDDKDKILRN